LNSCRNPWRAYWRRRALRPEDRWVLRLVEDYEARLAEDRGRELAFGETRVAEIAKTARVCQLLALAAFVESGIMRSAVSRTTSATGESTTTGGDELHPAFRELPRYVKLELDALKLLGIERAKPAPVSLQSYLEQKYGAEAARPEESA
jgi:hypothetical protein